MADMSLFVVLEANGFLDYAPSIRNELAASVAAVRNL